MNYFLGTREKKAGGAGLSRPTDKGSAAYPSERREESQLFKKIEILHFVQDDNENDSPFLKSHYPSSKLTFTSISLGDKSGHDLGNFCIW